MFALPLRDVRTDVVCPIAALFEDWFLFVLSLRYLRTFLFVLSLRYLRTFL